LIVPAPRRGNKPAGGADLFISNSDPFPPLHRDRNPDKNSPDSATGQKTRARAIPEKT